MDRKVNEVARFSDDLDSKFHAEEGLNLLNELPEQSSEDEVKTGLHLLGGMMMMISTLIVSTCFSATSWADVIVKMLLYVNWSVTSRMNFVSIISHI